jgi:hypothetical protein
MSEVGPSIVRATDRWEWQRGLHLIKQHLEENILILGITAVEDKLQVTTHGEHAGAPPALLFELVEIVCLEIVAVNTNQAD